VPFSFRLRRPLVGLVLSAVLLAPFQPAPASADPSAGHPAVGARPTPRATQTDLTAYGDADGSGAIHLSGSLRWANGRVLGHRQPVELWARTGRTWVPVDTVLTDPRGDVELSVVPGVHTTYELRFAGSRSAQLSSPAAASRSTDVQVRAVARVTLATPVKVRRGQTFVVTGKVTPARAGRVVSLTGNGKTFTTLRTRADGSFTGHVRLRMQTTLKVTLPHAPGLDGGASGPRLVRVG
jgi:hypothetical protein